MPVLKVRCPECNAIVQRAIDPINEPIEFTLICRKCDNEFVATVDPEEQPTRKSVKNTRRRDDDDDEKEKPRRKAARKSNNPLIVAGVVAVALLIGGGVLAVVAFSGSKDKDKDGAKVDPPKQEPPRQDPKPLQPRPQPNGPSENTNPTSGNPATTPEKNPQPPEVKPNPTPDVLPPAVSEDVLSQAATFKPTGPLPELPPLPPADRRPILTLDPGGHTAFVRWVFFTANGSRVITVGEDKSIRIWDFLTGETIANVHLPAGPNIEGKPHSAALSPDGKLLAVGVVPLNRGKSGIPIYLLSTETGELEKVIAGARNVPSALDFSPDGKQLALGCANGLIQVIEIATGKRVYEVPGHTDSISEIRFNPKLPLIATVGMDKEVKVWSLADASKPTATISLVTQKPNTLDWSSDGTMLAVGTVSGEVFLYHSSGKPIRAVPAAIEGSGPIQIVRLRFLPGDGQLVYCGIAIHGWAGVIDIASGKRPIQVKDHTNTVIAIDRTRDGTFAVSSGGDLNETIVWRVADGSVIRKFAAPSRGLWAVGWGKDGKSLAWGAINNRLADGLCPLEQTFRLDEFVLEGMPEQPAFQRHVRDDGTYSVKVEGFFKFTVLENGKPLYQYTSPEGNRIYSVTILPGKGIVVGGSFSMVLLDMKTGKTIRHYLADTGLTTALAPSPDGRYFISGSTDQIVRVWVPDQNEPLLSIFNVGHEWIAWTPQGYYACSPYGERLIGWLVNNGTNQLPTVHPAVRFRPSLYQPALIKYLIPAGNLQLALAMVAQFDQQAVAVSGLGDVLPPNVTVTAPATTNDAATTVKAVAEGNAKNPIVAMRLLVDGRPYLGVGGVKRFNPGQPKAEAAWQVALASGPHTLTVQAESAVSKGMSAPVAVTRNGKVQDPNLYVLAIGVSDYPDDMKLNYAASDAELISRTFKEKSKAVFGTVEIRTLTDKNANKRSIMEGLDWLGSKMTSKDVGIFFFSGHGMRDPRGRFFLVPVDVKEEDPAGTCVSGDEFKTRLENMPGRLVAILDACHSGTAAATTGKQKPKRQAARPDNLVRDLLTDDYGVVVMCSSLGQEYSMESRATKAGFYTLGLTEGLNGRADFNGDGIVYISELDVYATLRVSQLSGGMQNPTTGRPPTIRPFPLAAVDRKP